MKKNVKEVTKESLEKVGDFVKDHRATIAAVAGIGIGTYIGYKSGIYATSLAIQIHIPEAWEIIKNYKVS